MASNSSRDGKAVLRTPLLDGSTPLSMEEICIQVDSLREVASGLMESICQLKVKSANKRTISPERLQGPYS